MKNVCICYGHLKYLFYVQFALFNSHLVYFGSFGIFSRFWYFEPRKNLATLLHFSAMHRFRLIPGFELLQS
jgi:hypothetical protein